MELWVGAIESDMGGCTFKQKGELPFQEGPEFSVWASINFVLEFVRGAGPIFLSEDGVVVQLLGFL